MSVVFVVNSRRFGKSLGIDLSPNEKCCNFDCLYCELGKAPIKTTNTSNLSVDYIINEVKNALNTHKDCDYITITANGEPTLYQHLDELINKINQIKSKEKSLILSNSSTIYSKSIQQALLKLDSVKLSLDSVIPKTFKKIDRTNISLENIINGIISFSQIYQKELILECLILKNLNDSEKEMKALNEVLGKIKATRLDLSTIDRPSDYDVSAVSYEKLQYLASFLTNININIACRKPQATNTHNDDILKAISLRPLSIDEVKNLDKSSQIQIQNLVQNNKIKIIKQNETMFYKAVKS